MAVIAFFGACFIAVVVMIVRAPKGYEDSTGFHYGDRRR